MLLIESTGQKSHDVHRFQCEGVCIHLFYSPFFSLAFPLPSSLKPYNMSISDSCKAYERFHSTHYQDEPFPMSKSKLIRYIKFRARSSTFTEFLTELDKHPQHGPEWLQEMNSDPDVKKLMDLTITLWPRIAKQCKEPLIGVGNVYETPSFKQKYGKYIRDKVNQEAMYRERVHVVEGKKSRGFMVTDPTQTMPDDIGTSSDSPINLDHPTPSVSPIPRSKSTTPSNSPSTASKYTSSTKYAAATSTSTSKTTTTLKSTTKYDAKIDEVALRKELLQQMMMPNQMRLVSQFKPSVTTKPSSKPSSSSSVRSTSPSTPSSSSKATAKKEASPAEPPVKSTSSSKPKSIATKKESIIQKKAPATQKKAPVAQKKNTTISKKQSEKDLWKLAQKVTVNIERPQEEEAVPHQPVVKIVKKKSPHHDTSNDIQPASSPRASPPPEIRHPVVLIRKPPPRRKKPTVKITKKDYTSYPQQQEDEDQEERIKEEEKDNNRNKRQKREDYLYDQDRLQIVRIVIENHDA